MYLITYDSIIEFIVYKAWCPLYVKVSTLNYINGEERIVFLTLCQVSFLYLNYYNLNFMFGM